jgi:hypothetical protein
MSVIGTKLPFRDVRWTVVFEGKAEVARINPQLTLGLARQLPDML